MAQLPLGPVPNTAIAKNPTDDAIWHRWFEDLRKRLVLPQQIFHNLLGGLQGGTTDQYYHLTAAEHAAVLSGSNLKIIYNNESLTVPTNTQVTGHASITFTGTGSLVIQGTGSLAIL